MSKHQDRPPKDSNKPGNEGDFWSRRKQAVREAEQQEKQKALDSEQIISENQQKEAIANLEEMSDAEVLQALELPEPESLQAGDDFSVFMESRVPDRLRRRALSLLWKSNPVLANIDGLVDYGEDFTDAATVVDVINSSYQVGKGLIESVRQREKEAEAEAATKTEAANEDEVGENTLPEEVESGQTTCGAADAGEDETDEQTLTQTSDHANKINQTDESISEPVSADEEIVFYRRRMRFSTL